MEDEREKSLACLSASEKNVGEYNRLLSVAGLETGQRGCCGNEDDTNDVGPCRGHTT